MTRGHKCWESLEGGDKPWKVEKDWSRPRDSTTRTHFFGSAWCHQKYFIKYSTLTKFEYIKKKNIYWFICHNACAMISLVEMPVRWRIEPTHVLGRYFL